MKLNSTVLIALFLISAVVQSASSDPEVNKKNAQDGLGTEARTKAEPKVGLNGKSSTTSGANLESKPVDLDPSKKEKVLNDVKDGKKLGDKENGLKDKDLVDNVGKKMGTDEGSGAKEVRKEDKLPSVRKGSFRGEQCDSSFKCTIGNGESHGMIACLSVPGDESTQVSLIIQNKGKGLLDVNISAPDFVRLDKPKVTIQENDDEKVMVSIGEGKTEKLITLKTSGGSCSLDFMDFLTHNPMKKSNYMSQLTYTSLFRRTPFLGLLSLALILVIVSVVVCITYQKRRFVNNGSKYQKLDAELPVSGGPKIDFDQKDGWDDNWSDDWGDVEAPSTPSMPLTPSISSAGVSSRRVNKDAWKD
ncbi:hypothetical protein M8C21_013337 [Ambrosia artemisiifolia]|uniref:DUF7356 domain-containing protein n=1 Tax=Ambrosia artemisiifolia TaxID=4212 RepID=A0AAD5G6L8_AMBAR|nr:hypothetical protein M8C21_013337 [Ambrosia artemisiifolia]